jgi:transcriptional regulator with XRE-family HTH domain
MKISAQLTDAAILGELGQRITGARLERNLTQAALAADAGVSKRTIERLESGAVATQLSGFIRVCRVLGLADGFDALIPAPVPSPVAQLKMQGRTRQRASGNRTPPTAATATGDARKDARPRPSKQAKPWTWGEP